MVRIFFIASHFLSCERNLSGLFSDVPVATLNVVTGTKPSGSGDGSFVGSSGTSYRGSVGERTSVTVREGTSVALTCHVNANPVEYNVTWFHNVSRIAPHIQWLIIYLI